MTLKEKKSEYYDPLKYVCVPMDSFMRKLFNQEFALCYREPYNITWTCETGYKNVEDVTRKALTLRGKSTTFFTTYHYIPIVVKEYIFRQKLTRVVVQEKH